MAERLQTPCALGQEATDDPGITTPGASPTPRPTTGLDPRREGTMAAAMKRTSTGGTTDGARPLATTEGSTGETARATDTRAGIAQVSIVRGGGLGINSSYCF